MTTFNDVSYDVYSDAIASYADLVDLYQRRHLSRRDLANYQRFLFNIGPNWRDFILYIDETGRQPLHDWLQIHRNNLGFDQNHNEAKEFILALLKMNPRLADVAFSFPEIDVALQGVADDFLLMLRGPNAIGFTFGPATFAIAHDLIVWDVLAERTIIPLLRNYPWIIYGLWQSLGRGETNEDIEKYAFLALLKRHQVYLTVRDLLNMKHDCGVSQRYRDRGKPNNMCQLFDTYPYVI